MHPQPTTTPSQSRKELEYLAMVQSGDSLDFFHLTDLSLVRLYRPDLRHGTDLKSVLFNSTQLGTEGWELAAIRNASHEDTSTVYYFKRSS
jgi:hypothetical protein